MTFQDPGGQQQTGPATWSLTGLVQSLSQIAQGISRVATVLGNSYIALSGTNLFTGANTFSGSTTYAGPVAFQKPPVVPSYSVGALPAATQGALAFVTDSTVGATAVGATVAGGGPDFVPVYGNPTGHWVIG